MSQLSFRKHHLLQLLAGYSSQTQPLDLFINYYFRSNKSLGSKDRKEIAETVYNLIRWLGLLNHFSSSPITWEKRLAIWEDLNTLDLSDVPPHLQVSFPKVLYDLIVKSHGDALAKELCLVSNSAAPTTVRVNPLKISRDELLEKWKATYEVSPCQISPLGIVFHKKINFFNLDEFKEGYFEVQDEGSQCLADLMDVTPGDLVLDYCSGSGGKTLAFGPKMDNKGQIYLHDIRPRILIEAKKRLKRSGMQNGQIINPNSSNLKRLKKKMDWILVDAPCSGTGTLRRNPDMKWKFTDKTVPQFAGLQRNIFEKALSFVKPGGKIVYATCSILREENEDQVAHFLKTYPLKEIDSPFQSLPKKGEMDGFFGAVFTLML